MTQSVTYRYREFPVPGIFHFFGGIGTGIGKYWYRKKVSEPVSEKFGTGKKSRNRYRKNLVPEKVPVSVSKIFGTGKKYRYRYRSTFWVPSHTGTNVLTLMQNTLKANETSLEVLGSHQRIGKMENVNYCEFSGNDE